MVLLYFGHFENGEELLDADLGGTFVYLGMDDLFVVVVARVEDGLADGLLVDEAGLAFVELVEGGLEVEDGGVGHSVAL